MGRAKVFKWNLFFGSLLIVVNIINGIILVPIYLQYIDPAVFGLWLASGNILAWLSLVDPGIGGVLLQRVGVAFGRKDLTEVSQLIGSGLMLSICITLLLGIAGYLFFTKLPIILDIDENYYSRTELKPAFFYALVGTMLMIVSYGITSILQALQSSVSIGVLFIVNISSSLLMVLVLLESGFGLIAIGLSILFRGVVQLVGSFALLLRKLKLIGVEYSFRKADILGILRLSSFNFLGKASGTLHGQVQLFFIARYVGSFDVAVYKFTQTAPDLSKQFLIRPMQAFIPSFLNLLGEKGHEGAKSILVRMLSYFVWIVGLSIVGFLVLNESFVSLWVGEDFYAGSILNGMICLAVAVSVLLDVLSQLVFALGDVKWNNMIQFFQLILFLLLAYWGVTEYGLRGLVAAYIISHIVSVCYYPRVLIRMINFTFKDLRPILYDASFICLLVCAFYALYNIQERGVMAFAVNALFITSFYVVYLLLVSKNFRAEVSLLVNRLR